MVNEAVPVALFPWWLQLTVAVAGPGRLVEGFQVQDTLPSVLAVWVVRRAALPEADPEA
jgi:hypothetical protein